MLWIFLIFLPPVGIFYMWLTKKEFTTNKKTFLTVVFVIWFICILVNGNDDTENDDYVEVISTEATSTPEPTEEPTEKPAPTTECINSDWELISRAGHPTLFSSVDEAHEFWGDKKGLLGWKDREDKKISYPDTTTNSSGSGVDWGSCILEMGRNMLFGNCYSDYIFDIHICFDKFEKSVDLELNEALELASSYLPYDTLNSYYEYSYSTSYKAKKTSDTKERYYDISYSPINENSYDFVLNNHSYTFPVVNITLRENGKGCITDIWIDLYQSICREGRNSIACSEDYKEIEWSYDFLSN